jgi:hypothetical protein
LDSRVVHSRFLRLETPALGSTAWHPGCLARRRLWAARWVLPFSQPCLQHGPMASFFPGPHRPLRLHQDIGLRFCVGPAWPYSLR